jgi:ethylmalonyl-CoA/methylmalonyl-CoA decarboxylase
MRRRGISTLRNSYNNFLSEISGYGEGNVIYNKAQISEIILDNPKKRNALSGPMINQLIDILDDVLYNSPQTIGLILRGKTPSQHHPHPPVFCAGLDFSLAKSVINTPEKGVEMCTMMTDALTKLKRSPILSVALIHGPALGGGAELSTACDFRAMTTAPSTEIGFVHATIGASPGWGGATRLLNIVGRNKALHLLCSAQRLTPLQAVEFGLCDHIFELSDEDIHSKGGHDHDMLSHYGHTLLSPYLQMPYPNAVKDLKSLISELSETPTESQLQIEKNVFLKRWGSEENSNALKKK